MARKAGTDREQTRSQLLRSALQEFTENGYEKASLRTISANAGVTTGALYFFFRDKEDLLAQCVSPLTDYVLQTLQDYAAGEEYDKDASYRMSCRLLERVEECPQEVSILLHHRDLPLVIRFYDDVIEQLDRRHHKLFERNGADLTILNQTTLHWTSHLELESFLQIISHQTEGSDVKKQLRNMLWFMQGGIDELLERSRG